MLEIHQLNDLSKYSSVLETLPQNNVYEAVEAYDTGGNVTGYAIYSYTDESVCIYCCEYNNNDILLCDGILRTVLFKACLKGIDRGICYAETDGKNLFEKMHYGTPERPSEVVSINDFLDGCKNCGQVH